MGNNDSVILFAFFLVGLAMTSYGVQIRAGRIRYWWAMPNFGAGQEPFIALPCGIMFLLISIGALSPIGVKAFFLWPAIGCGFLGLVFLIVKPRFLKPNWLQWLEDNHEESLPLLRGKARAMGAFRWAKRTRTLAALEDWVKEILSGQDPSG